jgi:hypothetical protein
MTSSMLSLKRKTILNSIRMEGGFKGFKFELLGCSVE